MDAIDLVLHDVLGSEPQQPPVAAAGADERNGADEHEHEACEVCI